MKKSYNPQYDDPRWQAKRLEIFQRDTFRCRWCGNEKLQLHCHHLYYITKRDVWAYPNGAYRTLCSQCHDGAHTKSKANKHLPWEQLVDRLILVRGCSLFIDCLAKMQPEHIALGLAAFCEDTQIKPSETPVSPARAREMFNQIRASLQPAIIP